MQYQSKTSERLFPNIVSNLFEGSDRVKNKKSLKTVKIVQKRSRKVRVIMFSKNIMSGMSLKSVTSRATPRDKCQPKISPSCTYYQKYTPDSSPCQGDVIFFPKHLSKYVRKSVICIFEHMAPTLRLYSLRNHLGR